MRSTTANEGDSRAWGEDDQAYWDGDASKGFVEEFRVKHLVHVSGFDRRAGDDLPPQLRDLAAGALLNPTTFAYCGATAADPGDCRADENLGRLTVAWTDGYRKDANGDPVLFDVMEGLLIIALADGDLHATLASGGDDCNDDPRQTGGDAVYE